MINSDEEFFPDDLGSDDDDGLDQLSDNRMMQFEADKKLLVALCKTSKISMQENFALRRFIDMAVMIKNDVETSDTMHEIDNSSQLDIMLAVKDLLP